MIPEKMGIGVEQPVLIGLHHSTPKMVVFPVDSL